MPLAEKLALNQMKFTVLIVVPLKPELMELVTGGQEFVCGGLHPTVAEQVLVALVGIGLPLASKLHRLVVDPLVSPEPMTVTGVGRARVWGTIGGGGQGATPLGATATLAVAGLGRARVLVTIVGGGQVICAPEDRPMSPPAMTVPLTKPGDRKSTRLNSSHV